MVRNIRRDGSRPGAKVSGVKITVVKKARLPGALVRRPAKAAFSGRSEAGRFLAQHLTRYANRADVLVLGVARGGIPVAAEVAKKLGAPLDVFVVRKLRLPDLPDMIFGTVASGGACLLDREICEAHAITNDLSGPVVKQEQGELVRKEKTYRGDRSPIELKGKTVIVVDDGIVSGATMRAAVASLRQREASLIVLAAPAISEATYVQMRQLADDVAAVIVPEDVFGGTQWFREIAPVGDAQVHDILAEVNQLVPGSSSSLAA